MLVAIGLWRVYFDFISITCPPRQDHGFGVDVTAPTHELGHRGRGSRQIERDIGDGFPRP